MATMASSRSKQLALGKRTSTSLGGCLCSASGEVGVSSISRTTTNGCANNCRIEPYRIKRGALAPGGRVGALRRTLALPHSRVYLSVMALTRPRDTTIRRLFALSMNQCAFPGCSTSIVDETGTIVGRVCHIRAQSAGGPRYDPSQTDEQRHDLDNLILMCATHHAVIDDWDNLATFTVEYLVEIKRTHEETARSKGDEAAPQATSAVITALAISAMTYNYESGAVHNDFRNATFKVGGEGGRPLGAGGQGGVLIISGFAKLPDEVSVNLDGTHGQAPGGGGGGGGALRFEGRDITHSDIESGLAVRAFTAVNGATVADHLLYTLGAGYSHYELNEVPATASISTAWILDLGRIPPDTLLRMEIICQYPDGEKVTVDSKDVHVYKTSDPVKRCSLVANIQLKVQQLGIYTLHLGSASMHLAEYPIEFRLRKSSTN
ncbi:HNH endonuclease [Nocardia arthritidis]|uniref:HNH endonuclease n=1 Tax=Nocardia arthritidis TaxID=228602 RepID=UPI000AFFCBEE|nr:HNH endonuclease [Nocardia arthritidis]